MRRFNVGIIGATGMVGQRFISLLQEHPWFDITLLAASPRSVGKTYAEAVRGRWAMAGEIPARVADLVLYDAADDAEEIARSVDFVFCAVDMPKADIKALEERYAKLECPVISNNSAHRGTADVPMIIPEINGAHCDIVPVQRKRLSTKRGFVAVKSNCSLQSYLPALFPLRKFGFEQIAVATYQAISGAGKTFETFPEIMDNIIPYIGGEEEKSEQEPLKILGRAGDSGIVSAPSEAFPVTAQCVRVPVSDGHMGAVFVKFKQKPSREEILELWDKFLGVELPSAPEKFITYFEEDDRPQTRLDRDLGGGFGIAVGRLREDSVFDYKFVCLSHNTVRGAAGGAILMAEQLAEKGYLDYCTID